MADLVTVDTLPPGASPIGLRWINLSRAPRLDFYRDVCNKVCEADSCSKHPIFGPDWGRILVCSGHNPDNLRNVIALCSR